MKPLTNLQKRVLASVIYFPAILLSAVELRLFAFSMALVLGISWHEYLSFKQTPRSTSEWIKHSIFIFIGTLPPLFILSGLPMELSFAVLFALLEAAVIWQMINKRSLPEILQSFNFHLLGFVYLTGLISLFLVSHSRPGGKEAVWFLFFVVALTDTGAYFAGRLVGKTPFFQNISPSKTFEGFLGGVGGGILIAILYYFIFTHQGFIIPSLMNCVLLALFLAISSVFGDLFESLLKRHYGVKDSGHIIPGHGGVMDRFDGVFFAAMPLFFYMILRGGFR